MEKRLLNYHQLHIQQYKNDLVKFYLNSYHKVCLAHYHQCQQIANHFSLKENLLLICGHYKGIDQRVRDHFITKEISIGDYVLSGGELAAAVLVDSTGRLIPGILNDETSALTDSFPDNLLAPPVYTRPETFRGWKVPEILMGGNHAKIDQWRMDQSLQRTKDRRPDLLDD